MIDNRKHIIPITTVRWNLVYCETKTPRCHQHHKNVNNITPLLMTLRAVSKLIGIFHIGNFCFWVPLFKQLLLRNCEVDFVEICNVHVGKMIINSAKRIFNSDKICHSYSGLNFGIIFLKHSVLILQEIQNTTVQQSVVHVKYQKSVNYYVLNTDVPCVILQYIYSKWQWQEGSDTTKIQHTCPWLNVQFITLVCTPTKMNKTNIITMLHVMQANRKVKN